MGFGTYIEAGGYASSSDNTPFWLRTGQFGIVPNYAPAGVLQASISKKYVFFDSLANRPKKLDWKAAVSPVLTFDKTNNTKVLLPEAFASVRFKNTELYVGRRKELMGLGDSTLTSGFYSGSGNALPIPKIQIGTIGFTPLKFTKSFLAIHAGFSHGWFNTDYLDGVRLHQKFLYFRLGKPKSKAKFYFGLNHNVLWAGHSDYLKQHPELALDGKLPSSWKFYPNVIFAYTSKNWFEKNGYGAFDSYRLGNHLGSYDFAFDVTVNDHKLFVYHQHPFEDVSSMLFKNIPDGLYGINYKTISNSSSNGFRITHLTLEFLTTKDQSGSTFYIPGSKYQGADNYFSHSQYTEGWSYLGRTIGTPFIIPSKDMDHSKVVNDRFFPNNRVNMWYIGVQGAIAKSWLLTFRTSYSRNFGTPGANFDPVLPQLSSLLSAQYRIARLNTSIIAKVAIDRGDIFTKNTGGYLGIRKSW
ncbi:capsule assembly Wzi family protein [Dyadobacter luticola]|uniref:Capsule assembly Wzi family protein n=2 Tax=Dyadobacter luticola TaxID=1979387 RepID=A0A5R9KZQ4_9BACT|nr:capsule assembly Wzi family protein [Dyadobacter luticola]